MAMTKWTPKDAVLGILVAAIRADGKARGQEAQAAVLNLEALARVVPVTTADLARRFGWMGPMIDQMGPQAFASQCASALPQALRLPAFAAVVDVLVSDHEVTPGEVEHLKAVASALAIPDDAAVETLRARIPLV